MLSLLCGLGTLPVVGPPTAMAAPREFPTIIVLGAAMPLDTAEGRSTPIIVLDHESGSYYGDGTLSVQLRTSRLDADMRHPVAHALALGYGLRAQVVSVGYGSDLYREGDRLPEYTFEGYRGGLALLATAFPTAPWQVHWDSERQQLHFAETEVTAPDTVLPQDTAQMQHRLRLRGEGLFGEPDAELELGLLSGRRAAWRAWALDAEALEHRRYRRGEFRWTQPQTWSMRHRSELALTVMRGDDVDLISGVGVGGFGGEVAVAGYYRNEFRTERLAAASLSHEWRFADDRRVSLHLDGARLRELPLPYLPMPVEERSIAGVAVGFRYGIRSLGGLPLIVRFGQGLRVPKPSKETHRREVLLAVAAGF